MSLLADDVDGAIRLLDRAQRAGQEEPSLWSDLAAVHLRAAHSGRGVHHLVIALDAAERALRIDPELAEARFNQAVAMRDLGLPTQAWLAWGRYVEVARADRLDEEGREWLQALPRDDAHRRWQVVRAELLGACRRSDFTTVRSLLPGFGYETRELIERDLLPRWAVAVRDRRWAPAEEHLAVASCIARGRAAVFGSPLLAAALARLEALQERRDLHPLDALAAAHVALEQGFALAEELRFAEAEERFVSAEAELRRMASPLAPRAAAEVAAMRFQAHDHAGALVILDALERSTEGLDPSLAARVLWLRGLVYFVDAQHGRALRCYLAGLAAAEATQDATTEATLNHLVGEVLTFTGAQEAAWPYLLAGVRGLGKVRNARAANRVISGAAYAALHSGQLGAAIGFQREAARITRSAAQPTVGALALRRRALLESRLGDQPAALRSLAAAEGLAHDLPPGEQRGGLLADLALAEGEVHLAVGALDEAGRAFSAALAGYEETSYRFPLVRALAGRAQALRRGGSPEAARADLSRGVREILRQRGEISADQRTAFLDAAAPLFEELVANLVEIEQRPDHAFRVADLLKSRTLMEERLDEDPASEAPPQLLAALRRSMPRRTALLELFVLPDRTYAWFFDGEDLELEALPVGAEEWAGEVERFRDSLLRGASGCSEGRQLFDRLLGGFHGRLRTISTLFVVADGPLHRLPFAALCTPAGRWLVEDHAVARLPSAAHLVAALRMAPGGSVAPGAARALVVGDPAFDRRLFPHLESLPASRSEAEEVAAQYPAARLLMGEQASRREVLTSLPEFEVLHLATHSLLQESGPESSLVLAPGDEGTALLSERDIATVRLYRHPVVVLPVCGSAIGQPSRSEGQLSLARAFLRAGAAGVVATLWPVEDEAAGVFSRELHRKLSLGVPALTALRAVQTTLRRSEDPSLSNPATWAAFELNGLGTHNVSFLWEVPDVHAEAVPDGAYRPGADR